MEDRARDRTGHVRDSLVRLVTAHRPADERESAAKERFVSELSRLATCVDRDADPVHVTASAIVVGPRGVLLHRHRLLGRWLQLGGHVDVGEAPADAAVREVKEESGLVAAHPPGGARLVHLDVHPAPHGHVHLDLRYLLVAGDDDPAPPPGESPEVAWFGWAAAEEVAADAGLVSALRAAHRSLRPEVAASTEPSRA